MSLTLLNVKETKEFYIYDFMTSAYFFKQYVSLILKVLHFFSKDDVTAMLSSRPQTGLSFLAPEPEDLEDLYSRYKV